MATISCPNCNAQMDENKKFCTECGTKLVKEQPVQAAPIEKEEPLDEIAKQDTQKFAPWTDQDTSLEDAVKAVFQDDEEEEPKGKKSFWKKRKEKIEEEEAAFEEELDANQQTIVDFSALAGSTLDDSPYEPISAWGFIGILALLAIPVIGWIFAIVWACGGCRKLNKRNLARGYLMILGLIAIFIGCAMLAVMKIAPSMMESSVPVEPAAQEEVVYTVQGTNPSEEESSEDFEEGTDSLITRLREIGSGIWDAYHNRELDGGAELTAILDGDKDALIALGYSERSVDQVLNMVNGDFEALSSLLNLIEGQDAE